MDSLSQVNSYHELAILWPITRELRRLGWKTSVFVAPEMSGRPSTSAEQVLKTLASLHSLPIADAPRLVLQGPGRGREAPYSCRRLLQLERPDLVLMATDALAFPVALLHASRRAGIPTALVQEGAQSADELGRFAHGLAAAWAKRIRAIHNVQSLAMNGEWRILANQVRGVVRDSGTKTIGYGMSDVDAFYVLAPSVAEEYRKRGSKARSLRALGVPLPGADVRLNVMAPPRATVFTYPYHLTKQIAIENQVAFFTRMATTAQSFLPGWDVRLRVHPRDHKEWYVGVRLDESTLSDCLASTALGLAVSSTALLQVAQAGGMPIAFVPSQPTFDVTTVTPLLAAHGLVARDEAQLEALLVRGRDAAARFAAGEAVARSLQTDGAAERIARDLAALVSTPG